MLSFLIVGSGYRAEFYGRIAAAHPDRFQALFLCRSAEKAAAVSAHCHVPAVLSLPEALAFQPDFVVIAVDKAHIADQILYWAGLGFAVLAETPVAASRDRIEKLRLLKKQARQKIVCCEQYARFPVLEEGLAFVKQGILGEPVSAYLSLAHDYHAFSLLRVLLDTRGEACSFSVFSSEAAVTATDSRSGPILDGRPETERRHTFHLTFASGKTALYDFSPLQYHSFIRSRHLILRGPRGEWSDGRILYLDQGNHPQEIQLKEPFDFGREQDEAAIFRMLADMEAYLQGGPVPYLLEDALDDAAFWLASQDALRQPASLIHFETRQGDD